MVLRTRFLDHIFTRFQVTIDMKSDFFNKERDSNNSPAPQLKITNDDSFFMRFDGTHRMWYTMTSPDEIITPELDSEEFGASQVKTIEMMFEGKNYILDVPVVKEIRTKHGIFLTLDTDTDALIFTQQNYNRMKESQDADVILFRDEYEDTLKRLAKDNTQIATYKSLAPEPTKFVEHLTN